MLLFRAVYLFMRRKKMTYVVFVLLSCIVLLALFIIKAPYFLLYRKFRRWIWHRWIIWKIERNMAKTSIETKKPN